MVNPGKYLLEIKGLSCLTSKFSGFDLDLQTLEVTLSLSQKYICHLEAHIQDFISTFPRYLVSFMHVFWLRCIQGSILTFDLQRWKIFLSIETSIDLFLSISCRFEIQL